MFELTWLLSLKEKPEFPEEIRLSRFPQNTEELLLLLDKPIILKAIKERLVPLVKQKTKDIEAMYLLFSAINGLGKFISKLEVEDQPSKKVREFFRIELGPKLSKLPEIK